MKRCFDLNEFTLKGDIKITPTDTGHHITWPKSGGSISLTKETMNFTDDDWKNASHIVIEITGLENFCPAYVAMFMGAMHQNNKTDGGKKSEVLLSSMDGSLQGVPFAMFNVGALPGMRVKIPFALSMLDSEVMFQMRTPGRLKQLVLGHGIKLDEVAAFILTMKDCHQEQCFILHDIYLTDSEPSYTLDHKPIVDKLGQLNTRNWFGKNQVENDSFAELRAEHKNCDDDISYPLWSKYGGDLNVKWESTGFFRTHHDGNRWYLVDPEGYRFISTGLDCCAPGEPAYINNLEMLFEELPDKALYKEAYSVEDRGNTVFDGNFVDFPIVNLIKAFGAEWKDKWAVLTKNRLVKWGFTTIGNWSNPEFINKSKLPYVWPLDGFPSTKVKIFRDFPDVFSDEYEKNSVAFAEQLRVFKNDPYMIGYFLCNEPHWAFVQNLLIAEKVLENPENTECKKMIIKELQVKYGCIDNLNKAWNKNYLSFDDLTKPQTGFANFSDSANEDAVAFSKILIKKFAEMPSKACKAVDPEHMNLGMRYAILMDPILLEGHEYFDVFSINGYQENPYKQIQLAGELTNKPVLIGEFHFGALDAGMLAAGICSVATQKDRGLAYRQYYEDAMNSTYFIGAHYFILNDQAVLGRFDGENMQIGLVDVCNKPYAEFVREVAAVNHEIYKIADGKRTSPLPIINRIPRLMGF